MTSFQTKKVEGGLGVVKGLQVAGVWAGFRKNPNRLDFALIVAPEGAKATGMFTQSVFAAAPVRLCRQHLNMQEAQQEDFKALIINSGNANAATGEAGYQLSVQSAELLAKALDCKLEQILVASTGVIGVEQLIEPFTVGIPKALKALSSAEGNNIEAGLNAASAIMTTDTRSKTAARKVQLPSKDGGTLTGSIGGMAKGSGMIAPHMATMITVLASDFRLEKQALDQAFKRAVNLSFNKVTVDSDTSTNDSAYLIATGSASDELITLEHPAYEHFVEALTEVCQDLSYQIAADGEGATKVVVVDVLEAANDADADKAARAIADSPLVKTAVAGHDANWGRIAMAIGKSGASFDPEEVSISIMDMEVFCKGVPQAFSEEEALQRFEERNEVHIVVSLGAGAAHTRIWTCDLTHGYIEINGDYRT